MAATNSPAKQSEKTPKKRSTWTLLEEKQFLHTCIQLAIAEQLDISITTAGNEEVYKTIKNSLEEEGLAKDKTLEQIRTKYRRLKKRFHEVKTHNLTATGRSRMEWPLYDLCDQVWGHRPAACKRTIIDTDLDDDELDELLDDDQENVEENTNSGATQEEEQKGEIPKLKQRRVVKKFKGEGRSKKSDLKALVDSDNYFIEKMVELEEKRLENQLEIERERIKAEKASREMQMQFQRDLMSMMHMHTPPHQQHYYGQQQVRFNNRAGGSNSSYEGGDDTSFNWSMQ